MGSCHHAICECGFKTSIRVGGNMRTHKENSTFPCYCEKCGMVEVNVAKSVLECPECESLKVTPYGDLAVSEPIEKWPSIQWGHFKAPGKGNLCPTCKKKTMAFSGSYLMFD